MQSDKTSYNEVTERYCSHVDGNVIVKKKNLSVGEQLECINFQNCEFGKNNGCQMCQAE